MKQAVVALIIKDGLILSISRRHNKNIFGLIGGKVEDGETLDQALIREVKEEAGIDVHRCMQVYQRVELGDGKNKVDFYSSTYYALDWTGEPKDSEEGEVKWLTADELTDTKAAFGDYNTQMLKSFRLSFPDVYLVGE
jgi:8-oxo-dGTP diphosphatase